MRRSLAPVTVMSSCSARCPAYLHAGRSGLLPPRAPEPSTGPGQVQREPCPQPGKQPSSGAPSPVLLTPAGRPVEPSLAGPQPHSVPQAILTAPEGHNSTPHPNPDGLCGHTPSAHPRCCWIKKIQLLHLPILHFLKLHRSFQRGKQGSHCTVKTGDGPAQESVCC